MVNIFFYNIIVQDSEPISQKRNSEKFQLLLKSFLMVENKVFLKLRMFSDQSCVNRTETVHGTLHFLFLLSPVVWNMCEKLHL